MKEKVKITEDRKLEGERLELYELFRKKYPGGKKELQMDLCLHVAEERIEVYRDIFTSKVK